MRNAFPFSWRQAPFYLPMFGLLAHCGLTHEHEHDGGLAFDGAGPADASNAGDAGAIEGACDAPFQTDVLDATPPPDVLDANAKPDAQDAGADVEPTEDAGPGDAGPGDAGATDAEPILDELTVDIVPDGVSSLSHVISREPSPLPGVRGLRLPAMVANLQVFADGSPLPVERTGPAAAASTLVDVPAGARVLRIEYDQLDASLPYEGLWYLENLPYDGPARVSIRLPAGSVVDRNDGQDLDPDPARLLFDLGPGESVSSFVAYRTPTVPDLYDDVLTPHFEVRIPQAYRPYEDMVLGLLENAYVLNASNTGQDVNQIQNQARYPFYYLPPRWRWFGSSIELGGGLSIKGFSVVNARLIPQIGLPTTDGFNIMVAISLHELGNGWWGVWESSDPANSPPPFIDNEGHSGFFRAQDELDLGYCADAQREHAGHYGDFLGCTEHCPAEIFLDSFVAKYGWGPLRAYYAAIQNDTFDFRGMDELTKNGIVVRFLSEQVGSDLVAFFESVHVPVSAEVARDLAARLPIADVPVLAQLDCRTPTTRVANTSVEVTFGASRLRRSSAYVCSPGGFTAIGSPGTALAVSVTDTPNCGTADVRLLTSPAQTGPVGTLTILNKEPTVGAPVVLPVVARGIANLLTNGQFESGLASWQPVSFLPDAVMALDTSVAHEGSASAEISATTANDARFIQSVTLQPNTTYMLSGYIRTANVQGSIAGANLTLEFPGDSWANTPGLSGTQDFTYVFLTFRNTSTTPTAALAEARLGHYGNLTTGTAWFDDLILEPIP